MDIAIIGAGKVGTALAQGWARAGHRIRLGVRDPAAHAALAAETGGLALSPAEAAAGAPVVVLALPWAALEPALGEIGGLAGKIVIDCTNPLAMIGGRLALDRGHTTSGGETVGALLPGAHVVKTLNQVGAEILADNAGMASRPAMFMAGDDASAKAIVGDLLRDLGFDAMDAGPLVQARLLEPLALVWINQALVRGKGRAWALAALPNP